MCFFKQTKKKKENQGETKKMSLCHNDNHPTYSQQPTSDPQRSYGQNVIPVGCNERKPNITAEYRKTFQQYQQSQQNQQKAEREYGNFVSDLITQIDELITQQNDLQKQLQEEQQTKYAVLEDNRILQSENDKLKKDHSDDFATQRHLEKKVAELEKKNRIRDLMEKILEPLTDIIGTMDIQNNKVQKVYYNDLLRAFDSVGIHIIYYKEGETIPDKALVESYPRTTDNPTLNEKVVLMEKMGCTFDSGEPEIKAKVTQYKYEKPQANEVPKKPVVQFSAVSPISPTQNEKPKANEVSKAPTGQSSAVPPTSPTQNEKPKANEAPKAPTGQSSAVSPTAVPPTSPVQTGKPNEQSFVSGDDVYLQSKTDPQKRFYFLQKGKTYCIAEKIPIKNILSGASVVEQYYIMFNTKLEEKTPYSQIELYSNSFYSLTKDENGFRIMFSIYDKGKGKAKALVFPITLQEPKKEETKVEAFTSESFVSGVDVYFQSKEHQDDKYYILKKGEQSQTIEKSSLKNLFSNAITADYFCLVYNGQKSDKPFTYITIVDKLWYSITKKDGSYVLILGTDQRSTEYKITPFTKQEPKVDKSMKEATISDDKEIFISNDTIKLEFYNVIENTQKDFVLVKKDGPCDLKKRYLLKDFQGITSNDLVRVYKNNTECGNPQSFSNEFCCEFLKEDGGKIGLKIVFNDKANNLYLLTIKKQTSENSVGNSDEEC